MNQIKNFNLLSAFMEVVRETQALDIDARKYEKDFELAEEIEGLTPELYIKYNHSLGALKFIIDDLYETLNRM